MSSMVLLLLFFLLAFFAFTRSCDIDYSDIEGLGIACSPRDTCSISRVRTFFNSNCECDGWCHSFNDCCIDAPYARGQKRVHKSEGITCFPSDDNKGAYAISKCKSSWNGSDVVRRKCEDDNTDLSDPLMYLPSTDIHTNATYRNHYCAECNYGNLDNLSSWEVTLTCSSLAHADSIYHNITEDFIVQNIILYEGSWGVYHWNDSLSSTAFYPCQVTYRLPHNLEQHVRLCRPNVISTCSANWSRHTIRRKCLKYMAVLYIGDQAYRNGHCALCNRVSIRNSSCDSSGITTRTTPSVSFTLLLDVNQSDGDRVGETSMCPSGQKWDPFAKRCRTLTCALPGHVYRGGKCVAQ